MLDEMTCTKELNFDTRTLVWKGIVDYGGELHVPVPNGICDHVLVFAAQVFKGKPKWWIQPFAWFGTKGAAPVLRRQLTRSNRARYGVGEDWLLRPHLRSSYKFHELEPSTYKNSDEENYNYSDKEDESQVHYIFFYS